MLMNRQPWREAISERNFHALENLRSQEAAKLADSDIAFLYKRAICAGSLPIIKFLLESGYSVTAQGEDGLCALDYAEQLGPNWVKEYLENNAPVM